MIKVHAFVALPTYFLFFSKRVLLHAAVMKLVYVNRRRLNLKQIKNIRNMVP